MNKIKICNIKSEHNWNELKINGDTLFHKGHIYNRSFESLGKDLKILMDASTLDHQEVQLYLKNTNGHFAFIYKSDGRTLVAVDKCRTIPMFFTETKNNIMVSPETLTLLNQLTEQGLQMNEDAVTTFRMSGYTIGRDSIYQGLNTLRPGEYSVIENRQGKINTYRYYIFEPWNIQTDVSEGSLIQELSRTTLAIIERLYKQADRRGIAIPISGGYDSRLIASALKEVGASNIFCFSYGSHGNYDAKAGKRIAQKLGYDWLFIPHSLKNQQSYLKSNTFLKYVEFSDSCSSLPFIQDNYVINYLKENNIVAKDTIFINGNTGDFISGGHILKACDPERINSITFDELLDQFIVKHYALWGSLLTAENKKTVRRLLLEELNQIAVPQEAKFRYSNFEYLEFMNRQAKFVISGQRSYEYFGYEWRLPLWEDEYLQFFNKLPLRYKKNQYLYKKMLVENNWGNVWKDIPLNKGGISPKWIIPLRFAIKLLIAPFGKKIWHNLEKRIFAYYMDQLGLYSQWPYHKILLDQRGARSIVSWRVDKYLIDNNLSSYQK
jgi:asparagine synthase (glutamine-hydrolysing)